MHLSYELAISAVYCVLKLRLIRKLYYSPLLICKTYMPGSCPVPSGTCRLYIEAIVLGKRGGWKMGLEGEKRERPAFHACPSEVFERRRGT